MAKALALRQCTAPLLLVAHLADGPRRIAGTPLQSLAQHPQMALQASSAAGLLE